MKVRVGTYNVNNLFERPKVMELEGFNAKGKEVLKDVSDLESLLENTSYAGEVGIEIVRILNKYFHEMTDNPWFRVNEVREKLYSVKQDGTGVALKAKGRGSWVGWVELLKQETNEISIQNTARVIKAINVDILCVVEVDDRIALKRFNEFLLRKEKNEYPHTMVIDGNDERGIDVGVLSRFPIESIKSHIDDEYEDEEDQKIYKTFSRDCAEYKIDIGNGRYVHLLCNHLKSKGYGDPKTNNKRRRKQAERVVEILKSFDLTKDLVIVAGDFNDTPGSAPLKSLMAVADLTDVLKEGVTPNWTYHTGDEQIDYLLVSKPIADNLKSKGIERRGIFKQGNESFAEVTNHVTQASDHAAVYIEFEV